MQYQHPKQDMEHQSERQEHVSKVREFGEQVTKFADLIYLNLLRAGRAEITITRMARIGKQTLKDRFSMEF